MKNNTFPIILALVSILLGALALPNSELRIYGIIIFSILFLLSVVWIIFNKINENFTLIRESREEVRKFNENFNLHTKLFELEERIKKMEAAKK